MKNIDVDLYIKPSFIKIDSEQRESQEFLKIKEYINEYFKVKVPDFFAPKNPHFIKQKFHFFYNMEYSLLPTGLLDNLTKIIPNIKNEMNIQIKLNINDLTGKKDISVTEEDIKKAMPNYALRDYQIGAVKKFFENRCCGLLEGSVASGKTMIFGTITRLLNVPTLIIVGKIDLAHAGMTEFINNFKFPKKDVGIVQGMNIMERKITFCTIQSLEKINDLNKYKLIIIDETHHASSDSYQNLLMVANAPYRLGVSGTITGLDSLEFLKVKSFIGNIFYKVETKELVDKDILAKPMVYIFNIREPNIDPSEYGSNWLKIEDDLIVNNDTRNTIISDLAKKLPLPCLILVRRIPHGEILQKSIPNSTFLNGSSETETRKEYIKLMSDGKPHCVIATDIFNEGINMVELKSLIIAGALKSYVLVKQRAGRGLRKSATKDEIKIVDFYDKTHRILEKQSNKRINIYRKDNFNMMGEFDTVGEMLDEKTQMA